MHRSMPQYSRATNIAFSQHLSLSNQHKQCSSMLQLWGRSDRETGQDLRAFHSPPLTGMRSTSAMKRWLTETSAVSGQLWNQSMTVQLTRAGNMRARTRSVLPTGEKQRTTWREKDKERDNSTTSASTFFWFCNAPQTYLNRYVVWAWTRSQHANGRPELLQSTRLVSIHCLWDLFEDGSRVKMKEEGSARVNGGAQSTPLDLPPLYEV